MTRAWINDEYVLVGYDVPAKFVDCTWETKTINVSEGETYTALLQPEIEHLHCRYCDCNVETAPTCSQCGAPLKNPSLDAPIGYITSWSI